MEGNGKARLARGETPLEARELTRLSLRFRDRALERVFRDAYFRDNLTNTRVAFLGGAALWVLWGLLVGQFLLRSDRSLDVTLRYTVFIPILLIALALSFTPFYRRIWEGVVTGVVVLTLVAWVLYISQVRSMPPDFGYVGVILITAFSYTLLRLRFLLVLAILGVSIVAYVPYAVVADHIADVNAALAALYIASFAGLGGVAAYRQEHSSRLLFLRERQLDRERARSDRLLLNILPKAIVDRLKARRDGTRVAEALEDVSVLFADAAGFTEQAAKSSPEEIVAALDELFRDFDRLADRYGLEKIKTVGDAYMAVAGAPVQVADHAARAAEMALDILEETSRFRWPSGDPIVMRIGVACGPVVAGVIGDRKFAYDLWGDTVNLASRLESQGVPGRIMVSEALADRLAGRYEFSDPEVVELKGKGPTRVRFLLGRLAEIAVPAPS